MAAPIRGYDGSITADGITLTFVGSWETNLEQDEQESGPFIGDNNKYIFYSGKRLTGTIEATIPVGKDAGQTALLSGAINGSYVGLVLTTVGGYTITIPSGQVSTFSMTQDAAENVTVSFEWASSGSFNIV